MWHVALKRHGAAKIASVGGDKTMMLTQIETESKHFSWGLEHSKPLLMSSGCKSEDLNPTGIGLGQSPLSLTTQTTVFKPNIFFTRGTMPMVRHSTHTKTHHGLPATRYTPYASFRSIIFAHLISKTSLSDKAACAA